MFDDLKTTSNNNNNNNESINKNENKNVNENENENVNENENENESDDGQYYLEQINNKFKKIDETKSFKDQRRIRRNTRLKGLLLYEVLWR